MQRVSNTPKIFKEVNGLYKIIPLIPFRKTVGVSFDIVPKNILSHVDGLDRVIHRGGALSPGSLGAVKRPWYMHPHQEDHLLVLVGIRYTDLYTPTHGRIERFEVSADCIKKNGKVVFKGAAILSWPPHVFHRIRSSKKYGSASLNIARRSKGFDIKTNFSIYDVNTKNKTYHVIRAGYLDQ
ncbi:MAG: hypothetical protein KKH94_04640 [Candidatus Omnitrophica bacterium]|nr:hypothetical protein [Candidatus Omnitrophota bacterium]